MDKSASPKADKTRKPHLDLRSQLSFNWTGSAPFHWHFVVRELLRSFDYSRQLGFLTESQSYRLTPALLVSISLKSLPSSNYKVWASDKLIPASVVHPFRSNVIDFDSQPRCWAGSAFDYVHYSVPRKGLDDIAGDLGYGRVCDYRLAVLEDDLVVAQITKSILSFLGHKDRLSVLALDQFSLILDIAIQSGFNDQAAFKRTFHQFVGVSPGRRRRYYMTNHFRP